MNKILITGATGFIGGRLAEIAFERGIPTVALVRTWSRAARLSRLPVEMVRGDILDLQAVRQAMHGCDVVFHCAVDFRRVGKAHRRSSVVGTRNVLQAALEAKVQRVVFLSSMAVYGHRGGPGIVSEEETCHRTGSSYADAKIEAEHLAHAFYRKSGLPVTILRPTIVYGPFSGIWTVDTVNAIRNGRMVLVNGGTGVCNCLYVDNLVEAILLSAQHPHAPGEVFNISDAAPASWKAFVESHARALGDGYLPLPEMTEQELEAARARSSRRGTSSIKQTAALLRDPRMRAALRAIPVIAGLERVGRAVVRNVLPAQGQRMIRETWQRWSRSGAGEADRPPPRLLPRGLARIYASSAVFSVEKARRVLGYDPAINFSEGMDRTQAWIKWARL